MKELLENMEDTGRKIIVYEIFFSYFFQERYAYGQVLIDSSYQSPHLNRKMKKKVTKFPCRSKFFQVIFSVIK